MACLFVALMVAWGLCDRDGTHPMQWGWSQSRVSGLGGRATLAVDYLIDPSRFAGCHTLMVNLSMSGVAADEASAVRDELMNNVETYGEQQQGRQVMEMLRSGETVRTWSDLRATLCWYGRLVSGVLMLGLLGLVLLSGLLRHFVGVYYRQGVRAWYRRQCPICDYPVPEAVPERCPECGEAYGDFLAEAGRIVGPDLRAVVMHGRGRGGGSTTR